LPLRKIGHLSAGETLLSIAVRYGVVYKELLEANAIVDPDRIYDSPAWLGQVDEQLRSR